MKNISVMLVEDNRDDEELAVWVLNKVGLKNICIARDGLEAIDKLFGNDNTGTPATFRPDIIFLDLSLTKVNGIDVLRRIRSDERTKGVKVAVLTSSEDPYCRQVCHDLVVTAYFSKPLGTNDVLSLDLC